MGGLPFNQTTGGTKITTFYVDDSGSDDAALPNEGTPWASVTQAAAYAGSGQTIILAAGTYEESGNFAINDGVTMQGADGLKPSEAVIEDATVAGDSYIDLGSNNTVSNLTVFNWGGTGLDANGEENVSIQNTIIHGGGHGVNAQNSTSVTVINNTIYNNSGAGKIGIAFQNSIGTVENNIVTDNNAGIYVDGGNVTVNYNNVYNNGSSDLT